MTGLTYKLGMSTLGTLTYGYDAAGQRTTVGGTYARTGLPAALASATYEDANQVTTFGGTSFTCDDNREPDERRRAELNVERAGPARVADGAGQRVLRVRSKPYYGKLEAYLTENSIHYKRQPVATPPTTEFLDVDCGTDTQAAFRIAEAILTSIFQVPPTTQLKVRFSNISLYDELIDQ